MKKPAYRKPYWIYNETYRMGFYFCPGFTEAQLAESIKRSVKYDCTPDDYDYLKVHDGLKWNIKNTRDDLSATFIWTRSAGITHQNMDTISHEAWHLVSEVFKTHGIRHDLDNDEPGAYLLGWIVRKCVRCLEEEK